MKNEEKMNLSKLTPAFIFSRPTHTQCSIFFKEGERAQVDGEVNFTQNKDGSRNYYIYDPFNDKEYHTLEDLEKSDIEWVYLEIGVDIEMKEWSK